MAELIRWRTGAAEIAKLLADERLEHIRGAAADSNAYLADARSFLESAERAVDTHPQVALSLAYDAARHACVGLLAQQGLRAKGGSHHLTVLQAVIAQFGSDFDGLRYLRRERNDVQYPGELRAEVSVRDARRAVDLARPIIDGADALAGQLGLFAN